jgi:hypothetical protein
VVRQPHAHMPALEPLDQHLEIRKRLRVVRGERQRALHHADRGVRRVVVDLRARLAAHLERLAASGEVPVQVLVPATLPYLFRCDWAHPIHLRGDVVENKGWGEVNERGLSWAVQADAGVEVRYARALKGGPWNIR